MILIHQKIQHFSDKSHHYRYKNCKGSLEETQMKDRIKTKYCENNHIQLIRIPYTEKNNIEKILIENLKLIK